MVNGRNKVVVSSLWLVSETFWKKAEVGASLNDFPLDLADLTLLKDWADPHPISRG